MTQLTPTLYAVEAKLPDDANDFWINNIGCIRYSHDKDRQSSVIEPATIGEYLEKDKWDILGTVTPDAIDFDCEEYVICFGEFNGCLWYMDYMADDDDDNISFESSQDSFRSLLTSKGCDLTKKHVIIKSKI